MVRLRPLSWKSAGVLLVQAWKSGQNSLRKREIPLKCRAQEMGRVQAEVVLVTKELLCWKSAGMLLVKAWKSGLTNTAEARRQMVRMRPLCRKSAGVLRVLAWKSGRSPHHLLT